MGLGDNMKQILMIILFLIISISCFAGQYVEERDKVTNELISSYDTDNTNGVISKSTDYDVYVDGIRSNFFEPRNVLNRLNSEVFPMATTPEEANQMMLLFPLVDTAMRYNDVQAYEALIPVLGSLRTEVKQKVLLILTEEGANV
jgi:hypothetical protein